MRVLEPAGQTHTGQVLSLTPETLSLQTNPEQVVNLLLNDVRSLELRKRSPGQGAAIGAVVVGTSGMLLSAFACSYLANENDPDYLTVDLGTRLRW